MFRDILPRSSRASVMEYSTRWFMADTSLRGQVDFWRLWLGGGVNSNSPVSRVYSVEMKMEASIGTEFTPILHFSGRRRMRSGALRCQASQLTDSVRHSGMLRSR